MKILTNSLEIIEKGKIGQFFCKHKNANWYEKKEPFQTLSGDMHYKVCSDCGKQVDERFIRHD